MSKYSKSLHFNSLNFKFKFRSSILEISLFLLMFKVVSFFITGSCNNLEKEVLSPEYKLKSKVSKH